MLDFLKSLFGFKAKPVEAPVSAENTSAPYKVPEPAATTPIPLVVKTVAPVVTEASAKAPTKPKAPARTAAARGPAATKAKAPAKPKAPRKPKISVAK